MITPAEIVFISVFLIAAPIVILLLSNLTVGGDVPKQKGLYVFAVNWMTWPGSFGLVFASVFLASETPGFHESVAALAVLPGILVMMSIPKGVVRLLQDFGVKIIELD